MTATLKILASGQIAGTSNTTIYTVPNATTCKLASAALHNMTNIPVTVSVSVLPAGSAVDFTHRVLTNYVLNAYDTITAEDVLAGLRGVMLGAGDFISVLALTGTSVDFLLTGVEIA